MRRSFPAAIGLVLLLSVAVVPANAQDDLEQARARREALQADAAATAAALDVLAAEDAEIVAALEQVEGWIDIQEAKLARAELDLEQAIALEQEALERAAALELELEELRHTITEQSVNSYIEGFINDDGLLLRTRDINSVPVLRFILDESTGNTADTADLLRLASELQADAIDEAEEASQRARTIRDDIERRIVELEATRADQQRIRAEVDRRIAELENEADSLAQASADVERFIVAELARIAEEERLRAEEAARIEAEREAERIAAAQEAIDAAEAEAERVAAEEAAAEAQRVADEEAANAAAEDEAADADADADEGADDSATATATPEPTAVPEPEPTPVTSGAPTFIRPVPGAAVSGYGFRTHPVFGTNRLHTGIDYNARQGDPIAASAAGTVIFVGPFGGYGNTVIIDHGGGYTTLYAHMSSFNVSNGAGVSAGNTVGFVGSTGVSTGPHLHFEIRVNGATTDPAPFL